MRHILQRLLLVLSVMALLPVQPALAAIYVTSSAFQSSTAGVVSGFDSGHTGFISRTTDGGQTFRAWTQDDFLPSRTAFSADAIFMSEEYTNFLQRSADGISWTTAAQVMATQTAQPRITGMTTLSGGRVAVVGVMTNGSNGQPAFLKTSADLGSTWTTQTYGPTYAPDAEGIRPLPMSSFSAVDAEPTNRTYAWAVGTEAKQVDGINQVVGALVRKTADGGLTWTPQSAVVSPALNSLSTVAAASSTNVFATDSGTGFIRSVNGGANWTRYTLPIDLARPVAEQYMKTRAIDARPPAKVVLVGLGGKIAWSADAAAATPVFKYYNIPSGVPMTSVSMLSDTDWIAFGDNETIARTTNAGTSWTVQSASAPVVAITSPAAGFLTGSGAVSFGGTASDSGLGVRKVEVAIRTTSGLYYNATTDTWQAQAIWLPATSADSWATWSYDWDFNPASIPAGNLVTVTARATDVAGLTANSGTVTSGIPAGPVVSGIIALGADYTATTTVSAAISWSAATQMRWRTSAYTSPWAPVSATATVTIPAGDGVKSVTFDFNAGGSAPEASSTDTITLDNTAPAQTWTGPASGFAYRSPLVSIAGTAPDSGAGLASAEVLIEQNGRYWNESTWAVEPAWMDVTVPGGWDYDWIPDAGCQASGKPVTVSVRTTDALGNTSTVSRTSVDPADATSIALTSGSAVLAYGGLGYVTGVLSSEGTPFGGVVQLWQKPYNATAYTLVASKSSYSNGAFSFPVRPALKTYYQVRFAATGVKSASSSSAIVFTPRASLTVPSGPYSIKRGVAWSSYGYLRPAHTVGTYPVRIYKERYVSGKWLSYGYVNARAYAASGATKYVGAMKLPYAGTWRIRAYHYDLGHAPSYSGWRTVRVY